MRNVLEIMVLSSFLFLLALKPALSCAYCPYERQGPGGTINAVHRDAVRTGIRHTPHPAPHGIVGTGGTGSAVIEQLIRLGAGAISAFDEQMLADTNVTRVYGSRLVDVDLPKVKLMERLAADIGLCTRFHPYAGNITRRQQILPPQKSQNSLRSYLKSSRVPGRLFFVETAR